MRSGFAIAASCVALGLLAIPSGAQADILNLFASGPPANGTIGFVGTAPSTVKVTIGDLTGSAQKAGDANVGTYFLGNALPPTVTTTLDVPSQTFPISVTEDFNFAAMDGTMHGTVTWNFITGNTNPAIFQGTFTCAVMGCTGAYSGFSAPGQLVDLVTTSLGVPSLASLASTSSSVSTALSTGAIQSAHPIPSPLMGAGLPGIVAACAGLFLLARRRRRYGIV
jgi:hypothetical protein